MLLLFFKRFAGCVPWTSENIHKMLFLLFSPLTLINRATFKKFMPGMTRFDVQDSLRVFEKNYHFFIFSKRNTNFSMSFFGDFEKSFCLKIHGGGYEVIFSMKNLEISSRRLKKNFKFSNLLNKDHSQNFPKNLLNKEEKKISKF